MSARLSPRSSPLRFDLGDLEISPEAASLLSAAELRRILLRHGRGDWGAVSEHRKRVNDAFVHPKNRAVGSYAQSLHDAGNVRIAVVTKQGKGRRTTRLSLL